MIRPEAVFSFPPPPVHIFFPFFLPAADKNSNFANPMPMKAWGKKSEPMNKYIDIERLQEDGKAFQINIKAGEKDREKEEASSLDKLYENSLNALDRFVKKGKKLEEENRRLADRCAKQSKLAETLQEERDMYKELYERTREENRRLREKCRQHKESTLCLADELARHKQENKRLKESMESLPALAGGAMPAHVEYHVHQPGSMMFKDGQMPGSRFQCGTSSSNDWDKFSMKI